MWHTALTKWTKHSKICMESQKTSNSQSNPEKEEQSWRYDVSDFTPYNHRMRALTCSSPLRSGWPQSVWWPPRPADTFLPKGLSPSERCIWLPSVTQMKTSPQAGTAMLWGWGRGSWRGAGDHTDPSCPRAERGQGEKEVPPNLKSLSDVEVCTWPRPPGCADDSQGVIFLELGLRGRAASLGGWPGVQEQGLWAAARTLGTQEGRIGRSLNKEESLTAYVPGILLGTPRWNTRASCFTSSPVPPCTWATTVRPHCLPWTRPASSGKESCTQFSWARTLPILPQVPRPQVSVEAVGTHPET